MRYPCHGRATSSSIRSNRVAAEALPGRVQLRSSIESDETADSMVSNVDFRKCQRACQVCGLYLVYPIEREPTSRHQKSNLGSDIQQRSGSVELSSKTSSAGAKQQIRSVRRAANSSKLTW